VDSLPSGRVVFYAMGVAVVKATTIHRSNKDERLTRSSGFVDALVWCCYLGCYEGEVADGEICHCENLKNQTTALIREAENRKTVVVTRRGKPVATLKPFEQKDLKDEKRYPTTAFDNLKRKILAKYPELAKESPEQSRRRFDKITKKIRKSLSFKTWQEMDRFAKGDRFGLAR
jgi:prevent-host-death family protein